MTSPLLRVPGRICNHPGSGRRRCGVRGKRRADSVEENGGSASGNAVRGACHEYSRNTRERIYACPVQLPGTGIYVIITTSYMTHEPTSTVRARRLRERRARGVVMVAPVEVGAGGVELLVSNGLLEQHQVDDRNAVGAACLAALEQWSIGQGARSMGQG